MGDPSNRKKEEQQCKKEEQKRKTKENKKVKKQTKTKKILEEITVWLFYFLPYLY